jgi:hypothetical protein
MKNLFLILIVFLIPFAACKKDNNDTPADQQNPLVFTSLSCADSTLAVGATTTFTATASGDDLTYSWSSLYGTFFGSGPVVQWSVCHADGFIITCEVQDKYGNKESKNIKIAVHE